MFLGVKAIEYSHKWDMGIFPGKAFALTYEHPTPKIIAGVPVSEYLIWISMIPAILLALFAVASVVGMLIKKAAFSKLMLGLTITVGGYFLGVVAGYVYQASKDHGGESHAAVVAPDHDNIHLVSMTIDDEEKTDAVHDEHSHEEGDHGHEGDHAHGAEGGHGHGDHEPVYDKHHPDPESLSDDVRIFFSIYYCMTGLHAIHIIAGIIALAWVYWRCLLGHWRTDYFGPVDYVGLYWHLVDLIWIYLFPLLYLID